MSALKNFFNKMKKDTKFKTAGPGYSLQGSNTDRPSVQPGPSRYEADTSAPSTSSSTQPKTLASSESQQKAAQAALARLEQRMGTMGKNTNLLREVFTEMGYSKVEVESGATNEAGPNSNQPQHEASDHPVLAVEGIFYKCPVIGPFVLSRDQMEKKIEEFLKEQYLVDSTIASVVMLVTFNRDSEKLLAGRETIDKYFGNIIENPGEEKFRKIRIQNRTFQERVLALEGADKVFLAAGFKKVSMLHEEREEEFFVLFPEPDTIERLSVMREYLMQAEPIQAELDRGLKIFRPSGYVARFNLPDEFYNRTAEEVQDEYKKRLETVERNQILRTKAMRERDEQKLVRRYRFTVLRIRLPGPDGGFILQGTFGAYEKISAVEEFVREHLINEKLPFILTTAVGNKLSNADARLHELELVPAAILNFQSLLPSPPSGRASDIPLLKDESMVMVQNM